MSNSVLLVEDDRDDALLMQHAWAKANFPLPLRIVTDGEQAIAYLQGRDGFADRSKFPLPCLVLLDLRLPKKSGFDVLRWIRTDSEVTSLPVAILSASRQRTDVQKGYAMGANSYLVKPTTLSLLCEMLEDIRRYWFNWNVFADEGCNLTKSSPG
jgi:DNA-binding response OmpR family regulator